MASRPLYDAAQRSARCAHRMARLGSRGLHNSGASLTSRVAGPASSPVELNKVSKTLTQSPARTAAQAMLEAAYSNTHAQLQRMNPSAARPRGDMPHVGIASVWWEGNPCNMHLLDLSQRVRDSVCASGGIGLRFNTIGVSDGISMGTRGMAYSLPSRDIIADSVESVLRAQWYDGAVVIPGCDKNMPGVIMGVTRVNVPSIMVYGGTIAAGCSSAGVKLDIVSAFQSYGELVAGRIDERTRKDIAAHACPGPGACGGMYTANTLAVAIEAMGMTLPHSSSTPAAHGGKGTECDSIGPAMKKLLSLDLRPRDILTKDAFHNAIVTVMALGGSTNAVLHIIAMAATAGVPITIDDFQRISDSTPFIANLKPSGEYVMEDVHGIGGTPAVMAYLHAHGLLRASAMSVTGQTIGAMLAAYPPLKSTKSSSGELALLDASGRPQNIIRPLGSPLKSSGHITILRGNLAPEGAVAKLTGKEGLSFTGAACVYDCEEDMMRSFTRGELHARLGLPAPPKHAQAAEDEVVDGPHAGVTVARGRGASTPWAAPVEKVVVVIRFEGPKGGPGMPEMLTPTSAIMGAGLSHRVALITDGRFSGGSHGFIVGHITPEAAVGGPLALLKDGDTITIDANTRVMDVHVTDAEMAARKAAWQPPAPRVTSGVLAKYVRLVASASHGCVTDGAGLPHGTKW